MAGLALYFLGPPRFKRNDAAISVQRRKCIALLAYLAVTATAHSREMLIDLLYPRQSRGRARADFRQTLSFLKNTIGEDWLTVEGPTVGLACGNDLWTDVHEFRALIREEHGPDSGAAGLERINRLTAANSLYQGDFLSGFYLKDSPQFDDWQFFEQEGLRRDYISVLEQLVIMLGKSGQIETAVEYGRRWLAMDPLEEAVHRELMRLYATAGQRTAALRQYEQCRTLLKKELGEDPEEETEELFEKIRSKRKIYNPNMPRTLHPNNIPEEPKGFIGREQLLAELVDTLEGEEVQILTLTGTGGTGKTRLAVEAAARMIGNYDDGVFFVDLAAVHTPEEVVPTIARILEVRESMGHGRSLLDYLRDYLRSKRLLLILDNFEHIISAAHQVTDLVAARPGLRVLITSREQLQIKGERALRVPPLEVSDPETTQTAQLLLQVEAVRLFAQRAASANPAFAVTDENVSAVAEICRHLDGLPLAIELAASRLKILSLQELENKLKDRFRLLGERTQARPARQQTLRKAIDWSYNLLDEFEKKLFTTLSVFVGGCSIKAVEHICGASGLEFEFDILDGLASLVDKSLVKQEVVEGESRFSMLETIAEYARTRFEGYAGAGMVRERHAGYYLELAVEAESGLHGPEQLRWLDRLEREISNLQSALSWFLQSQRESDALKLAISLEWFWYRYGHFSEGQRRLERTIEVAAASKHPILRARAEHALGWMCFIQGNWSHARGLYRRGLQSFRDHHDRTWEGIVLSDLGVVERWIGNKTIGDEYCEQAIEIAREIGDPLRISISLIWAYATTGGKFNIEPPQAELEEAVEISRRLGNLWGIAHGLNGLGDLLRELGKYSEARLRYDEALRGFRHLKDKWMTAWTLEGLGRTMFLAGDICNSNNYLKESMKLFHSLGDIGNTVYILNRIGMGARASGHHQRAARLLGSYKARHESLIGQEAASQEIYAEDLDTAFCEYQTELPSEWCEGQVMSLEQVIEYTFAEPCPD
jgi:predicted ATPase/DNA-binding SARP family transcriptional activator